MNRSIAYKSFHTVSQLLLRPRFSLSCVWHGIQERDSILAEHRHWGKGKLPRKALVELLPAAARQVDVLLPRALDRLQGWSLTIEEAGCLCAIVKSIKPRKILEIGTFDGNTALALAANAGPESQVVTVDLPLDFTPEKMASLPMIEKGNRNLTDRSQVGRQFKDHPLGHCIKQVYGDTATLDWEALGGPFDMVFIDGCHSETYVMSDTRNALAHMKRPGVILWHDYGMIETVSNAVDSLASEIESLTVSVILGYPAGDWLYYLGSKHIRMACASAGRSGKRISLILARLVTDSSTGQGALGPSPTAPALYPLDLTPPVAPSRHQNPCQVRSRVPVGGFVRYLKYPRTR